MAGAAIGGSKGVGAGAGTGLALGALIGSGSAAGSAVDLQRRYDHAYVQCMYARGNVVPQYGYRAVPPVTAPPPGR